MKGKCRSICQISLMVVMICFSHELFAATLGQFYQGITPVKQERARPSDAEIKNAFVQDLIKITGNEQIAENEAIKKLLPKAKDYVQAFSYETVQIPGQASNTLTLLKVEFDDQFINQTLAQAGQPIWPNNRPQVLLWVAVSSDSEQTVIGSGTNDATRAWLDLTAREKGLPIALPLMDLTDMNAISFQSLWQEQFPQIEQASNRYNADHIALVKIQQVSETNWQAQWSLVTSGQLQTWQVTGDSLDKVIQQGVAQIVSYYASQYAQITSTSGGIQTVKLVVSNVTNGAAYSQLVDYLRSLSAISEVNVDSLGTDSVTLSLTVEGGAQALEQLLAESSQLKAVAAAQTSEQEALPGTDELYQDQINQAPEPASLHYSWNQ